jgi:hypothetical protein
MRFASAGSATQHSSTPTHSHTRPARNEGIENWFCWSALRLTVPYFASLQGGGNLGSVATVFVELLFGQFGSVLEWAARIYFVSDDLGQKGPA